MRLVRCNAPWRQVAILTVLVLGVVLSASASVYISSPANGTMVSSPVHFVASATSDHPITAMRIYVDSRSAYTTYSNQVNTYLSMSAGSHYVVVVAWDSTGAASTSSRNIAVAGTGGVIIAAPTNYSIVTSPVTVAASATSAYPITAMRVYVDYQSAYTVYSNQLNTQLSMAAGQHNMVVQAWDSAGGVYKRSETVTVSSASPTPTPIVVSVAPASATVQLGSSQQFTATVSGTSNTAASWLVNGIPGGNTSVGTVSSTGAYRAPASMPSPSAVTVTALSAADNTTQGSATVSLVAAPATTSVTVSPATASVQLGHSQLFTAAVSGTTNTAVTWAVNGVVGGNSVVGTISTAGNYTAPYTMPSPASVSVSATSVADTTKVSTASVGLTAPAPTSTTSSHYGTGINADELANLRVGVDGSQVSLRFRAATSSTLSGVRLYVKTGSGYSGGTGGSWIIKLETDDNTANHYPSGTVLASTSTSTLTGGFPLVPFSSPASVTAGQIYHVVISNGDPNPTTNFVSVNNLVTFAMPTPMQPTIADSDWMTLIYNGSWTSNKKTPVLEVDYGNGASQGLAYVDAWASSRATISGSSSARETFTVTGSDRAAVSASFRVIRSSGSSPLTIRLEQADGTLVEQGTVPASSIGTSDTWVTYTFSGVRTLTAGQGYHLVLSAPSDTTYTTEAIQKGQNYGFSSTTYFKDGHAEANSGSGWTGVRSKTDADFEFYFTAQ